MRHFTVYETAGSFYIVGSDASEKSYYLLKFDRTDPRMLMIGEPDHEYSKNDVMELLATISEGNSSECFNFELSVLWKGEGSLT